MVWRILKRFRRIFRWFLNYYPHRNNKKFSKVILSKPKVVDDQLQFTGKLYVNYTPNIVKFVIRKFRQEEISISNTVVLFPEKSITGFIFSIFLQLIKIQVYRFKVITNIDWDKLPTSIYVFSLDLDELVSSFYFKHNTSLTLHLSDGRHTLHLFEERVIASLRLELFKIGESDFKNIINYSDNRKDKARKICLIYEYTNSARDNGISFFNYLSNVETGIRPLYIIENNNPDGILPDGQNVIEFGSIEHLKACIDADILAFTHHKTYCYPHILRDLNPRRYDGIHTVFLQHGVTALKKMVKNHYRKERCNYSSVVVCSDKERDIFSNFMNFPLSDIYVTGFPRYDSLYDFNSKHKVKNSLLVFPTWRKGLEKKISDDVENSLYFKEWKSALINIREVFDGKIVFIIHPILQRHAHLFSEYVDKISSASNFQSELVNSVCLITDYSSICFDALFLNKPVIMFQFDRDEYGFKNDAFINIDTELPGVFAETAAQVKAEVIKFSQANWQTNDSELRDLYFKWDDNKNSERLVEIIEKNN